MFPSRTLAPLLVLALFAPWHVPAAEPAALEKFVPTPEQLLAAQQPPRPGGRVYKAQVTPHWFADDAKFWYRNDLASGTTQFVLVDAETGKRGPAFDHAKLAAGLSKAAGKEYTPDRLPFDAIAYTKDEKAVRFKVGSVSWKCDLDGYVCEKDAEEFVPQPEPVGEEEVTTEVPRESAELQQPKKDNASRAVKSPDEKWSVLIKDMNVVLRDADGKETTLTKDGTEESMYGQLSWSPDSKAFVAQRTRPGDDKAVHLIRSSPPGGGRATLESRAYPLPGDKLESRELHLFDVAAAKEVKLDVESVEATYPFTGARLRWSKDGAAFSYPKHDRGHQRFRLIEVDARTGKARTLIEEKSDTFIWLGHLEATNIRTTTWLEKTGEILYATEKSGWRHLYLHDGKTGELKNAITSGEWVVRGIERIDEEARQITFRASGKDANQDPYHVHLYRVNFDGTGLVALTGGNGTFTPRRDDRGRALPPQFSGDRKYLVVTISRADLPPVTELRRCSDGKLVCKLEEADVSEAKEAGWEPPEVFAAKGRDDTTDIWGLIHRPKNLDPKKKYPVIEAIYAGPHDSHVPKAFSSARRFAQLNDLGFIVVQIDGMGTANRSKAFHDVCWKNIKDGGFPDRIAWHKAAAAKYPYYDATRVGIYGTSAGGQNALAALLFHGDFYKAAMAACGCHDNRLDKSSWNEQWMGYPVGPQYAACSNVDNAKKLTGKLLLIVGEQDHNVPPESTLRVVDALVKANKDFDLLVVPGMDHSDGGVYGRRRMNDFFVRHLHGVEPPDRNGEPKKR